VTLPVISSTHRCRSPLDRVRPHCSGKIRGLERDHSGQHRSLLMKHIKPAARRARTVATSSLNHSWARDIRGELLVEAIRGFLNLWGAIHAVPRAGGAEDSFRWKWTTDGSYSSKSAYLTLFHGTTALLRVENLWHSFFPLKFKLHEWLALHRWC
jgi:hypothetical protein